MVKTRRAVVLPEVAENTPERASAEGFGRVAVVVAVELLVNVRDEWAGELARFNASGCGDDLLGCLVLAVAVGKCEVARAEDFDQRVRRACAFGRANSFWSASWRSAARAEVNDLRLRLPLRSRQSA